MSSKFNVKRYFQVLGICVLILCTGFVGYMFLSDSNIDSELTPEEIATVSAEELDGKINVLLLGLDESELRTDTIILASYDLEADQAKIISIPRDTRIFLGSKFQKINAAHAMRASHGGAIGAQGTVEAVTRLTGIPINYYVSFPFSAVEECIDILGPVTYDVPDIGGDGVGMVYDDPAQDLHINLKPGLQELNGEQVVHLLRYRKGNLINGERRTYKGGDIERIGVQQDFLKEFVSQKLTAKLIADLPSLFNQVSKSVKTNFAFKDVAKYAPALADFDTSVEGAISMWTLPGQSGTIDGVSYYLCDLEQTRGLVEGEFGFDASEITDGKKKVAEAETPKPQAKKTEKPKATEKSNSNNSNNSDSDDDDDNESAIKTQSPAKTQAPKATEKPENDTESDEDSESATEEPYNTLPPEYSNRPSGEPKPTVPAMRPTSAPQVTRQPAPQITDKPQTTPRPASPVKTEAPVAKPEPAGTETPVKGAEAQSTSTPVKTDE